MCQSIEEGIRLYGDAQLLYSRVRSRGDVKQVVEASEQALRIFEAVRFDKGTSDAANLLGVVYASLGQHAEALEHFKKSLEIARKLGDAIGEGKALNNLGLVYADWGNYAEAAAHYEKSLEIKRKLEDLRGECATLNNLGNVNRIRGEYLKALENYKNSLEIAGKLGDRKAEAGALNSIGLIHKDRGEYAEAREYYEKSLVIAGKIEDLGGEGRSLNNLGNLYNLRNQYSKAVECYRRSLDIFRKLGDLGGEGEVLNNLGLVHQDWGQHSKAVEHYQGSLALKIRLGDVRGEGQVLNNLGLVFSDSGQYSKALEYYAKSLELFRKLGDLRSEADSLGNLGNIYNAWGRYPDAVECYEKSLAIAEQLADVGGQGNALNNLGLVYAAWGQDVIAVKYYGRSLAIKTKLGDVMGEGTALINLGGIHANRGEYEKALASFQAGLTKFAEIGAAVGWPKKLMGDLYLDRGDMALAEPLLKEAGYNASLGRLNLVKSDFEGARGRYEKLRQSAEQTRDVENLFTAYTGLGASYEKMGDDNKAEECFLKAIDLTEELRSSLPKARREKFFDVRINGFLRTEPYDGLARVRLRMNRPLDAFRDSEYTKSRIFSEAMSNSFQSMSFDIPADVLNKDRELNDRLAAVKKKAQKAYEKGNQEAISVIEGLLKQSQGELGNHIKKLRKQFPLFAATKYPNPMRLDETALKPNEWALAYHVTASGIIIYLTKGQELVKALFKPITRDEVSELVLKFRKPLEIVQDRDDFVEKLKSFDLAAGKKLSDLLLFDVLESLPPYVSLIVAPDDSLGILPFELLALNDKGSIKSDRDLPYISGAEFFGARNPISYCQSVTALSLARIHARNRDTEGGLLAIADPVFQEDDDRASNAPKQIPTGALASVFRRLHAETAENSGVADELQFPRLSLTGGLATDLAEMQEKGSDIYTGLDASKANFLDNIGPSLNRYDKILFATHGYFGADLPGLLEPVLILTLVPPGTDGYLRMTEVMGLNMKADIVALTACQTALGRRTAGEGTMGMGRAFQYAGARSVLMSLWSVSEEASVKLVKSFFRNMKGGKSKSEALALAREEIRKKGFDHPFFWGAFILVGETN